MSENFAAASSSSNNNNNSNPSGISPVSNTAAEYALQLNRKFSMSSMDQLFSQQHRCTVMSTPRMEGLAQELVSLLPDQLRWAPVEWMEFPDGTPNLKLPVAEIHNRDVVFLIDIDLKEMMPLISVLYSIPRYLARTFSVFLMYYACGTMERVESEGEVATAKILARLLSCTPSPQVGEALFHVFDIHALASRFFFSDTVKINLLTGIGVLQNVLRTEPDFRPDTKHGKFKVIPVFPDDGARKRFRLMFPTDKYDFTVFVKVRRAEDKFLMPIEGEEFVKDRHLMIVDDICMSGGTLLGSSDELFKRGAASVSMFVTHGVFPKESWKKFLPSTREKEGKPLIRTFYVTNSHPATTDILKADPEASKFFKILSLATVIRDVIAGTDAPITQSPCTSVSGATS